VSNSSPTDNGEISRNAILVRVLLPILIAVLAAAAFYIRVCRNSRERSVAKLTGARGIAERRRWDGIRR